MEKTINVRSHLPKWSMELKNNVDRGNMKSGNLQFITTDDLLIDFLYIPSENLNKGSIIFLHGIRANKYYFIEQAIFLSKKGFNCILPDLRGHGDSEGNYCTFGYLEKTDISLLIDHVSSKYKQNKNYGIWGHSMGASIAIQTLELDKRIEFMILEAPFSDLKTILNEYFHRKLWFASQLFFNQVINNIEKKLEFSIDRVKPYESAKNILQPSIILHGTKDHKIQRYHSNLIFNNLPSNNKIIYDIKNADHNNIKEIWKKEYYDVTLEFINNCVNQFQYIN